MPSPKRRKPQGAKSRKPLPTWGISSRRRTGNDDPYSLCHQPMRAFWPVRLRQDVESKRFDIARETLNGVERVLHKVLADILALGQNAVRNGDDLASH